MCRFSKNHSSPLICSRNSFLRYQNFDPYAILEVGGTSSNSQIKNLGRREHQMKDVLLHWKICFSTSAGESRKAFHKLSLKYHPDKNPDAAAAEKFILIKKAPWWQEELDPDLQWNNWFWNRTPRIHRQAYDALTDPVAKRNFRPDLSFRTWNRFDGRETTEFGKPFTRFCLSTQGWNLQMMM